MTPLVLPPELLSPATPSVDAPRLDVMPRWHALHAHIDALEARNHTLTATNQTLAADLRCLQLQVQDLRQQLWGQRSERSASAAGGAELGELFADLAPAVAAGADAAALLTALPLSAAPARPASTAGAPGLALTRRGRPRGRQPLDPALPREVIALPDPDPRQRVCDLTGVPLVRGFTETLEVLARRRPEYYVKHYVRTAWVSPAKSAPFATPWPTDLWPRARMHVSVVAHLATAHYADHQPFHRLEQQLARTGLALARSTQLSLMEQLDTAVTPLVELLRQQVLASDYLHLDATPLAVCDPARPGQTREGACWLYRVGQGPHAGTLWYDFQLTKALAAPKQVLTDYCGLLQTDGAKGLERLGVAGAVTHLGCWAHARRYFFKAVKLGEARAEWYLATINRLFRIDRCITHFGLAPPKRARARQRFSVPLLQALFARAVQEGVALPPKSLLGVALGYLLAQRGPLERCVTTPTARLDNNWAENPMRPLKLRIPTKEMARSERSETAFRAIGNTIPSDRKHHSEREHPLISLHRPR